MAVEIPGYKVLRTLGKGGMATVYLAEQEIFEREVALKVMSNVLAVDPTFGQRFFREAKIVSQLVHPNIVTVHDVGVHEGAYFLAMEYIDDLDLRYHRKHFSLAEKIIAIRDIAKALSYASAKGIVHRDIKPENIMFHSSDGRAVLTDFGIARTTGVDNGMTQTGMAIGTPHYMSPEQAKGVEVDARSDIYSLGVVFYLLITGNVPYKASSPVAVGIKHIVDPVPQLKHGFEILQPILSRMMAKNLDERYQNAEQLIEDLDTLDLETIEHSISFEHIDFSGSMATTDEPFGAEDTSKEDSNSGLWTNGGEEGDSKAATVLQGDPSEQRDFDGDDFDDAPVKSAAEVLATQPEVEDLEVASSKPQRWTDTQQVSATTGGTPKSVGTTEISEVHLTPPSSTTSKAKAYSHSKVKTRRRFSGRWGLVGSFLVALAAVGGTFHFFPDKVVAWRALAEERIVEPTTRYWQQVFNRAHNKGVKYLLTNAGSVDPETLETEEKLGLERARNGDAPWVEQQYSSENREELLSKLNRRREAYGRDYKRLPGLVSVFSAYLERFPLDGAVRFQADALKKQESQLIQNLIDNNQLDIANERLSTLRHLFPELAQQFSSSIEGQISENKKIEYWLIEAETLYKKGNLTIPKGASALDYYLRVLSLEPDNKAADVGLNQVADRMIVFAEGKYNRGQYSEARKMVKKVLAIDANHEKANQLLRKIQPHVEKIKQVDKTLEAAQAKIAEGQLIYPAADNALHYYVHAQQKDANNRQVKEGINQVLDALSVKIAQQLHKKRFDEAEAMVRELNRILPDHTRSLAIQEALTKYMRSEVYAKLPRITALDIQNVASKAASNKVVVDAAQALEVKVNYENFQTRGAVLQAVLLKEPESTKVAQVPVVLKSLQGSKEFKITWPDGEFSKGEYTLDVQYNTNSLSMIEFAFD